MNASPGGVNVRNVEPKFCRLVVRAREDRYSSSNKGSTDIPTCQRYSLKCPDTVYVRSAEVAKARLSRVKCALFHDVIHLDRH